MSERATPETDAVWADKSKNILEHARRLERERDEAQRACQLAHDRLLRGDNDREILDILAKGWRAAE